MKRRISRLLRRSSIELLERRQLLAVGHVVHVSVDGLGSQSLETILRAETLAPTGDYAAFQQLRSEGASTLNARTDFTHTNTLPNHVSMLTGRPVLAPSGQLVTLAHQWVRNSDPPAGMTVHNNHSALEYVPSVFDVVHDRGFSTSLYASKSKFSLFDVSYNGTHGAVDVDPRGGDNGRDKIDVYVSLSNPQALVVRFVSELLTNQYNYSFIHLAEPDNAGHRAGWGSDAWAGAVKQTGQQIGQILDAITADPTLNGNTSVIVTTDHGGIGNSHDDSAQSANYRIPFFVWGPEVPPGSDLYLNGRVSDPGQGRPGYSEPNQPIRNGDSGNLALELMGLPPIDGSTINRLHSCFASQSCTSPPPGPVASFDFGDAPPPYPTTLDANGAVHQIQEGVFLGQSVDADADGQVDPLANGDDLASDDEDGVVLTSELVSGETATLDVTASTAGILQVWFDWNADGDWEDASDLAIRNRPLSAGVNRLSIQVPLEARPGSTMARFRFSQQNDLMATGLAMSGEVEDYRFDISSAPRNIPLVVQDDQYRIRPETGQFTLNVLSNDSGAGGLTIMSTTTPSQGGAVEVAPEGTALLYTARATFAGRESFSYQVQDQQGSVGQANVIVDVQRQTVQAESGVRIRMETSSISGEPIESVQQEVPFLLSVFVQDLRPNGRGVAAAYVDVRFDGDLSAVDAIDHGRHFLSETSGSIVSGTIDEAGGTRASTSGVEEQLLFEAPLVAHQAGNVEFIVAEADLPNHFIRLFGQRNPLPRSSWIVDSVQLRVVPTRPTVDPRDVDLDGLVTPLDALLIINDLNRYGARRLDHPDNPPRHAVDVNRDDYVAAVDALLVINYLNQPHAGAAARPAVHAELATKSTQVDDRTRRQVLASIDYWVPFDDGHVTDFIRPLRIGGRACESEAAYCPGHHLSIT